MSCVTPALLNASRQVLAVLPTGILLAAQLGIFVIVGAISGLAAYFSQRPPAAQRADLRRSSSTQLADSRHSSSAPSTSSQTPGGVLADAISSGSAGLVPTEVWATPTNAPSAAIANFPAHPSISCWLCFEAKHRLTKGVVRKLYTNEDGIFEQLNLSLGAAERRECDGVTCAYTQLLAEALHDDAKQRLRRQRPPKKLYRGLRDLSSSQQRAFEARIGGRIYLHSFTSTSADPTVALCFGVLSRAT